jgi:hypothetical protein
MVAARYRKCLLATAPVQWRRGGESVYPQALANSGEDLMVRDLTVPEMTDFRLLRLGASVLTMFGFAILALMVFQLFVPWGGLNGWPMGMAQGIVLSTAMLFYASGNL